jgi:hypothetical protein
MTEAAGVPLHCWGGGIIGREGSGGHGPAGVALPGQESSGDRIDYDDKDGGQCHKRGGANINDKQRKRLFNNYDARQRQWRQQ